jgi:hypothetical protein
MARRRSKNDTDATASLDSFLDTLFNVAGILVIIIALAQITARETIKDVNTGKKSEGGVTEEMLVKKQGELKSAEQRRERQNRIFNGLRTDIASTGTQLKKKNREVEEKKRSLQLGGEFIPTSELEVKLTEARTKEQDANATWIEISNTYTNILALKDKKKLLAQLEKAQAELDDNKTALAEVEASSRNDLEQLENTKADLVVVRGVKTIEEIEIKLKVAEKDRDKKKRDFAKMNQELVNAEKLIEEREMFVAIGEMTVPVPHDPAPGLKEYGFICRHGRIVPDEHIDQTWANWMGKYQRWLDVNKAGIVARAVRFNLQANQAIRNQLTEEWGRVPALDGPILKSRFLQIDVSNYPLLPGTLKWPNEQVGDTSRKIFAPNSNFRKKMEELAKGKRHFITFYVFADSFEAYLVARKIADELKLAAGWKPFPKDGSLSYGGGAAAQVD